MPSEGEERTDLHLIIHAINPSQGIQEIWKKTAAEILGIRKDYVSIDSDFEVEDLPVQPEDTYNTISSLNELIKKGCQDIQKKRFNVPLPITVKKSSSATAKKALREFLIDVSDTQKASLQ